jgi:CUB domain
MTFTGWMSGQEQIPKAQKEDLCLGLQRNPSPSSMSTSNHFWGFQKCSAMGGYVCKKNRKNNVLIQNQTITGIEGRLTSPDYPNQYAANVDYWIRIIAPEKSRVVVQFQRIDIEQQLECLYDFVSIQDVDFFNEQHTKRNDVGGETKKLHQIDKRSVDATQPSFKPYMRWCGAHEGDMVQFDFVSRSNEIFFHFATDHSVAGEGFSANWRAIDISACPGQTFTSREGVLSSPNFPHFLLHNLNCSYTIQAPVGRKIWIEFNSFDIQQGAEVLIDLGDGVLREPLRDPTTIGDGVYSSRSEKVKIMLKTGASPRGKGFSVTFRTSNYSAMHRCPINYPLKLTFFSLSPFSQCCKLLSIGS